MSKIGKQPIKIPAGINVKVVDGGVKISTPQVEEEYILPSGIEAVLEDSKLLISRKSAKASMAVYGTTRANISNIIHGLSQGWEKQLEIIGTGYRAEVAGGDLVLNVGFSHPVKFEAPEGVTFKVEKTIITVSGADKMLVGKVASEVRGIRPPEPYKGKGIKYLDELIRRKVGKAAKAAGAGA